MNQKPFKSVGYSAPRIILVIALALITAPVLFVVGCSGCAGAMTGVSQ
jgi:hypothetical protein